ncbi:MAG: transcription antitermination protein NusB [Bacilli bacterium]|nr:transcription antitermination protein NusB [Bacilli bacterium]MBO4682458.1 transcription antitermination protein NusB [Bacilli bacterium]
MISRNQSHYIIMTAIYIELADFNFAKSESPRQAEAVIRDLLPEEEENIPLFILDSVNLSLLHYGEAVEALTPYLTNWKWERIPLLSQAILLMSYTHFYYVEKGKVDKKVVINTAVELGKKYVEEKQAKFINAILEKVLK